jgi:translation elongation factor EF-Ts
MAIMTEDGKSIELKMAMIPNKTIKPVEVKNKAVDEALLKEVVSMLPKDKVEATEPKNVITKMMVEGRADKLLSLLKTLFNGYIENDNYGNVSSTKTKHLVMTLMLEEKKPK